MDIASIDSRIAAALNEKACDLYFRNDQIKKFGWGEGYIVQVENTWYFLDIECETRSQLPSFVHSRADAEAFIAEAARWFNDGVKDGRNAAKRELRAFLEPEQ